MLLDGLKVLDFSRVLTGPWATMILAHLGAEIIKIEEPTHGDEFRSLGPPYIHGVAATFITVNQNKKSVTINLRNEDGRKLVHKLAQQVDVLIHNFRPSFPKTCGLDYDTVVKLNPQIIYCNITGTGEDGPYADLPGYDLTAQALSGAMSITGNADGPPVKSMCSYADILAGYNSVACILASLRLRDRTGQGQKISVNLLDSALAALVEPLAYYLGTGEPPARMGPDMLPQISPGGTFPTKDSYIAITAQSPKHWKALCHALGIPHVAEDPRFDHISKRNANRAEVRAIMEKILVTRTRKEWIELLHAAEVPAAPAQNLREAEQDPQIRHNKMFLNVEHPVLGPLKVFGAPFKIQGYPPPQVQPPPILGEHTEEVLSRYLNLSADDVANLRERGAV